jgi:protein TonB
MKKRSTILILLLIFIGANKSSAFTVNLPDSTIKSDSLVFLVVEEMPVFTGGEKALELFIYNNIKYPEVALKRGIEGNVYISFIVDTLGAVTKVKLFRGIGGGCDEEALRVVKMLPDFRPGKQNGRKVNVQFNISVKFNVKEYKKRNRK